MQERVLKFFSHISAWSWSAKLLSGALIGILAGGGVLSFLLQNAAFAFALTYGFRPPVEGIPYLGPMVAFGSISLLLIAATMSTLFLIVVKYIAIWLIEKVEERSVHMPPKLRLLRLYRSLPGKFAIIVVIVGAGLAALLSRYFQVIQYDQFEVCAWPLLTCRQKGEAPPMTILAALGGAIAFLMIWRPSLVWVGSFLLVALYYISTALTVLPYDGYGRLLRMTGFGGGISVTLVLQDKTEINTQLLMRSTSHVFTYFPTEQLIREYPMSAIAEIRHGQGGLHNLPFVLPPASTLMNR